MSKNDILGVLVRMLVNNLPTHMQGAVHDLLEKLSGGKGEEVHRQLLKFLRRETVTWDRANVWNPAAYFIKRNGLYVWDEFKEWIVAAAEQTDATASVKLHALDLLFEANDGEIRAALDGDHVFKDPYAFCFMLAQMLDAQWHGSSGTLVNNGCANIFYVRGIQGEVFTVRVYWDAHDQLWSVAAKRLFGRLWNQGDRAFSCNC